MSAFVWTVDGIETATILGGGTLTHTFETLGVHYVAVQSAASETTFASATARLMCKYVRRELRELSDADRDALLGVARDEQGSRLRVLRWWFLERESRS